jgi:hypothetical protein
MEGVEAPAVHQHRPVAARDLADAAAVEGVALLQGLQERCDLDVEAGEQP